MRVDLKDNGGVTGVTAAAGNDPATAEAVSVICGDGHDHPH